MIVMRFTLSSAVRAWSAMEVGEEERMSGEYAVVGDGEDIVVL